MPSALIRIYELIGGGELISEYASAYGRKLKFINELNLRPCTDVHFKINFPPFRFNLRESLIYLSLNNFLYNLTYVTNGPPSFQRR